MIDDDYAACLRPSDRARLARLLARVADVDATAHRTELRALVLHYGDQPSTVSVGAELADLERRRASATLLERSRAVVGAVDDLRLAISQGWWSTVRELARAVVPLDIISSGVH